MYEIGCYGLQAISISMRSVRDIIEGIEVIPKHDINDWYNSMGQAPTYCRVATTSDGISDRTASWLCIQPSVLGTG